MSCLFYHRKAAAARVFREKFPESGRGDENPCNRRRSRKKAAPCHHRTALCFYSASIIVSWSAV